MEIQPDGTGKFPPEPKKRSAATLPSIKCNPSTSTAVTAATSNVLIITPDQIAKLGLTQQINKAVQSQAKPKVPVIPPKAEVDPQLARRKNVRVSKITIINPKSTEIEAPSTCSKSDVGLIKNKLSTHLKVREASSVLQISESHSSDYDIRLLESESEPDCPGRKRKQDDFKSPLSKMTKTADHVHDDDDDDDVILIDSSAEGEMLEQHLGEPKNEYLLQSLAKSKNISCSHQNVSVIVKNENREQKALKSDLPQNLNEKQAGKTQIKTNVVQRPKLKTIPNILNVKTVPTKSNLHKFTSPVQENVISIQEQLKVDTSKIIQKEIPQPRDDPKQRIHVLSNEQISLPSTYIARLKSNLPDKSYVSHSAPLFIYKSPNPNGSDVTDVKPIIDLVKEDNDGEEQEEEPTILIKEENEDEATGPNSSEEPKIDSVKQENDSEPPVSAEDTLEKPELRDNENETSISKSAPLSTENKNSKIDIENLDKHFVDKDMTVVIDDSHIPKVFSNDEDEDVVENVKETSCGDISSVENVIKSKDSLSITPHLMESEEPLAVKPNLIKSEHHLAIKQHSTELKEPLAVKPKLIKSEDPLTMKPTPPIIDLTENVEDEKLPNKTVKKKFTGNNRSAVQVNSQNVSVTKSVIIKGFAEKIRNKLEITDIIRKNKFPIQKPDSSSVFINEKELKVNNDIRKTYSKKSNLVIIKSAIIEHARKSSESSTIEEVNIIQEENPEPISEMTSSSKTKLPIRTKTLIVTRINAPDESNTKHQNKDESPVHQETTEVINPTPKKRGRKKKTEIVKIEPIEVRDKSPEPELEISRRGRKRKVVDYFALAEGTEFDEKDSSKIVKKSKRFNTSSQSVAVDEGASGGIVEIDTVISCNVADNSINCTYSAQEVAEVTPKRKRGRPPRIKVVDINSISAVQTKPNNAKEDMSPTDTKKTSEVNPIDSEKTSDDTSNGTRKTDDVSPTDTEKTNDVNPIDIEETNDNILASTSLINELSEKLIHNANRSHNRANSSSFSCTTPNTLKQVPKSFKKKRGRPRRNEDSNFAGSSKSISAVQTKTKNAKEDMSPTDPKKTSEVNPINSEKTSDDTSNGTRKTDEVSPTDTEKTNDVNPIHIEETNDNILASTSLINKLSEKRILNANSSHNLANSSRFSCTTPNTLKQVPKSFKKKRGRPRLNEPCPTNNVINSIFQYINTPSTAESEKNEELEESNVESPKAADIEAIKETIFIKTEIEDSNLAGSSKRKTRGRNKANSQSDSAEEDQMVTCAVCNKEMGKSGWANHKLRYHNNLAWKAGEPPLDLNDQKFVMSVLSEIYKRRKPLYCEKCGESKKSVLGFLSHKSVCQKSTEEVTAMRVKCEFCDRSVLPVSMSAHLKFCRAIDAGNSSWEVGSLPVKHGSSPVQGKRKAAKKAHTLIKSLKEEDTFEPSEGKFRSSRMWLLNFDFRPSYFGKKRFRNEILNDGTAKCRFEGCEFETSDLDEILNHLYACSKKPSEGYTCKFCILTYKNEYDISEHLREAHARSLDSNETPADEECEEGDDCDEEDEFFDNYDDDNDKSTVNNKNKPAPNNKVNLMHGIKFLLKHRYCSSSTSITYPPAFDWTLKFCKQNFAISKLFPNWRTTLVNWEKLQPALIVNYLPHLKYSACTTIIENKKFVDPLKLDHEWRRFKLFEADLLINDSSIIFCGGPIFAMGWAPTPYDQTNCDQILAISANSNIDKEYTLDKKYSECGLIQVWNCGPLSNDTLPTNPPKLEFCIAHDYGPIWCLEWCPSGCYDAQPNNEDDLCQRLGVLAVGSADSHVYLYSVCSPRQISGKIFKPKPVLKLVLDSVLENTVNDLEPHVTKISWSKASGHQYLVAGYGNGMVAVFYLNTSSTLLQLGRDQNGIEMVMPYRVFNAHHHAVTALCLYHLNDGRRWIMTGSIDRTIKYWDLENPVVPLTNITKFIVTDGVWLNHWLSTVQCFDDSCAGGLTYTAAHQLRNFESDATSVMHSNSRVTTITGSDWTNGFVQGNIVGEIKGFFPHQMFYSMDGDKSYRNKKVILGYARLVEKALSVSERLEEEKYKLQKISCKSKQISDAEEPIDMKITSDHSKPEPTSYKGAEEKYGLVFCDMTLNSVKEFTTNISSYFTSNKSDKLYVTRPNVYPLQSINKVALNPNRRSFLYLATGYQAGFVRISCLRFLDNKRQF